MVSGQLHLPRYKIIVQTTVGQMRNQGIRVASRCLWDLNTDNYASASYTNVREIETSCDIVDVGLEIAVLLCYYFCSLHGLDRNISGPLIEIVQLVVICIPRQAAT